MTEGDRNPRSARRARRHRRLRQCAARRPARRRHRPRRALAQGPAHGSPAGSRDRRRAAARGPARRARLPRRTSGSASCRPARRVGTGSPRRAAQLRALGYGLDVVDIRGNVDTRLRKVADAEVDAVVLAARRPGPARPARRRHRGARSRRRCSRPPARERSRSSAGPTDEDVVDALATLDDTRHAGCPSRPSGRCSPPSKPVAQPRSVRSPTSLTPTGRTPRSICVRSSSPLTAPSPYVCPPLAPRTTAEALGRRLAAALLAEGADGLMGARVP